MKLTVNASAVGLYLLWGEDCPHADSLFPGTAAASRITITECPNGKYIL